MNPLILIVNDKPEITAIISMFLRSHYRTQVCTTGQEAVLWLETNQELPSLILVEINMADTDIYQLIRELKNDSRREHIPIIALFDTEDLIVQQNLIDMGIKEFVLRPFNPEELKIRIGKILFGIN
ncbi:MAG: response regulator [Mucinivorans sp.]